MTESHPNHTNEHQLSQKIQITPNYTKVYQTISNKLISTLPHLIKITPNDSGPNHAQITPKNIDYHQENDKLHQTTPNHTKLHQT